MLDLFAVGYREPLMLVCLIRARQEMPKSTIFVNLNSSYCRSKATAV